MERVHAKWGFGNAPLKKQHVERAEAAMEVLIALLDSPQFPPTENQLEAISYVKGQFTRTVKQDQWDWNTVWALLGRPSRTPANRISKKLAAFRLALKEGDTEGVATIISELREADIIRYLDNFLAGGREPKRHVGDIGFVYILSTRSQPTFLKIGMTQRTVEERVKEINSATGVIVPFGIRATWRVDNAVQVEKDLHELLKDYRVRADREFFEIDYFKASQIINDYLGTRRLLERGSNGGSRAGDQQAEQGGAGQPATRSESGSEGGDKPQPEAEGRSR